MELTKVHKIFAVIPESLFLELETKRIFASNFDNWIAEAINAKLKSEETP